MKSYKTADEFFDAQTEYGNAFRVLRKIILGTELVETVKWGTPVYTVGGKNVIGIGAFKSYFGIWFYQGVFLRDPAAVLINAQEGTTKALRQWRMQSAKEIDKGLLLEYLEEAISNSKAGKEVRPEKKALVVPPELNEVFDKDSVLQSAFEALNLTNKRDFVEHIETAKRAETKTRRLEKIIPMIRAGIGLNDKYKK